MEAWILHIKIDAEDETTKIVRNTENHYTAWCTEKQAIKMACKFIQNNIPKWNIEDTLLSAAISLIEVEKWQEAIDLINKYSRAEIVCRDNSGWKNHFHKYTFKITKSTFLGSPLE